MFINNLKNKIFEILSIDKNSIELFFFSTFFFIIFNIDEFLVNDTFQNIYFCFFYLHMNALLFFYIYFILLIFLLYIFFTKRVWFHIDDYYIVMNLFLFFGFIVFISGSFWGFGVWGFDWFKDSKILSLFFILIIVFLFHKWFFNRIVNSVIKSFVYELIIMFIIFFFIGILLKFSSEWWNTIHQASLSFTKFNYLFSFSFYYNFIIIFLLYFSFNLYLLKVMLIFLKTNKLYKEKQF